MNDSVKRCMQKGFRISIGAFVLSAGIAWMALQSFGITEDNRLMFVILASIGVFILSLFAGCVACAITYVKEVGMSLNWLRYAGISFIVGIAASVTWALTSGGSMKYRNDVILFGLFLSTFFSVLVASYGFKRRSERGPSADTRDSEVGSLEQGELVEMCDGDEEKAQKLASAETSRNGKISPREAARRAAARMERSNS